MTPEHHQSTWREHLWFKAPTFRAYREGRFVVAELNGPHWVTSTSSRVGGGSGSSRDAADPGVSLNRDAR